jgi:hypothetical protein
MGNSALSASAIPQLPTRRYVGSSRDLTRAATNHKRWQTYAQLTKQLAVPVSGKNCCLDSTRLRLQHGNASDSHCRTLKHVHRRLRFIGQSPWRRGWSSLDQARHCAQNQGARRLEPRLPKLCQETCLCILQQKLASGFLRRNPAKYGAVSYELAHWRGGVVFPSLGVAAASRAGDFIPSSDLSATLFISSFPTIRRRGTIVHVRKLA